MGMKSIFFETNSPIEMKSHHLEVIEYIPKHALQSNFDAKIQDSRIPV